MKNHTSQSPTKHTEWLEELWNECQLEIYPSEIAPTGQELNFSEIGIKDFIAWCNWYADTHDRDFMHFDTNSAERLFESWALKPFSAGPLYNPATLP